MLGSNELRTTLKDIFGIDDKYLVPLDNGWYVPTFDPKEDTATWIGYRILSIKPNVRAYTGYNANGPTKSQPLKVQFRLSFIGPQAEELCEQVLLWDIRKDVIEAFAKHEAQLNYNQRSIFTYPVKNGGLNTSLCWCVDIDAQTFYETSTGWQKWNLKGVDLRGTIILPVQEENNG